MRTTIPRQSDEQEQPSDRPRSWRKPEQRWRDEGGKLVRVYQCLYCRDIGLISLPKYRRDETDDELCGIHRARDGGMIAGMIAGTRFASYCPNCRGEVGSSTRRTLQDRPPMIGEQAERIRRWYNRMMVYLREEVSRRALERIDRPRLPVVVKDVPSLSGFEQDEIAADLREAKATE